MAKRQPQDNPSQDPSQPPDEGGGLTGLKLAWWRWLRHLFHRAEHYKSALEERVPDLEWRAKQVEGRNIIVVQKKGAKRPTEPFTFKVGEEEFTLLPGQSITITAEAAEALFGSPGIAPVLPKDFTTTEFVEEDDMPLNAEDIKKIDELFDKKFADKTISVDKISFSSKQMTTIVLSIVGGAIFVGGGILTAALFIHSGLNGLDRKIDQLDYKMELKNTRSQSGATSTDTHSPMLPTATGAPPGH